MQTVRHVPRHNPSFLCSSVSEGNSGKHSEAIYLQDNIEKVHVGYKLVMGKFSRKLEVFSMGTTEAKSVPK